MISEAGRVFWLLWWDINLQITAQRHTGKTRRSGALLHLQSSMLTGYALALALLNVLI